MCCGAYTNDKNGTFTFFTRRCFNITGTGDPEINRTDTKLFVKHMVVVVLEGVRMVVLLLVEGCEEAWWAVSESPRVSRAGDAVSVRLLGTSLQHHGGKGSDPGGGQSSGRSGPETEG